MKEPGLIDSHCHIDFIFSRLAELSPGSPESEDIEKIEIEVIEEIEEGEINEDIAIIREELVEVMEVKKEVNEEIEVYENFKEFQEKYKDEFSQNFQGCIAVFCEPSKWMMHKSLEEDKNVWFTFGIHPHFADLLDMKNFCDLETLLR